MAELTRKLRDAEELAGGGCGSGGNGGNGGSCSSSGDGSGSSGRGALVVRDKCSVSPSTSPSPHFSSTSSIDNHHHDHQHQQHHGSHLCNTSMATATAAATSSAGEAGAGSGSRSGRSRDSEVAATTGMPFGPVVAVASASHTRASRPASWSARSVFDSNPQFVTSYKAYLRQLGYCFPAPNSPDSATPLPQSGLDSGSVGGLGGRGDGDGDGQPRQPRQPADGGPVRMPLLSEYPAITSKTLPLDLRVFLPPKGFAVRLRDVFRRTIQAYTPLFCWPLFLEDRFERAWNRPVWEEDVCAVKGVFCVLQMVLAVACQMTPQESPELVELAGGAELQERSVIPLVALVVFFYLFLFSFTFFPILLVSRDTI